MKEFNDMTIGAVLLAAGLSERMGGPNKLLFNIDSHSVISKTYYELSESSINEVVIVTGRDKEGVERTIKLNAEDRVEHNQNFKQGMTSSIQVGVASLLKYDAIMICLGDMPWLKTQDYNMMIQEFKKRGKNDSILVPFYKGKRANPVIFGAAYYDDILNHNKPNGCSGVVKKYNDKLLNLNVDNERFIKDIDTREDVLKFKLKHHRTD